jgi:hypothetical protein
MSALAEDLERIRQHVRKRLCEALSHQRPAVRKASTKIELHEGKPDPASPPATKVGSSSD